MRKVTKRVAVATVLSLVLAMGSVITGNAASKVYKYTLNDGTAKEAVEPGKDWVVVTDVYSKEKGYGLNVVPAGGAGVYNKQVAAEANTKVAAGSEIGLDIDLTSDLWSGICRAMFADKNGTDLIFNVDLPAGTYKFTIYAGGISSNNTYDTNKIYLQGEVFDQAAVNGGPKDGSKVYKPEDIAYVRTITLKEATTVEVKASNPKVDNAATGKTDGGRAYLNAVVIEEVSGGSTYNPPKTGDKLPVAAIAVVAVASVGVMVMFAKKREEA